MNKTGLGGNLGKAFAIFAFLVIMAQSGSALTIGMTPGSATVENALRGGRTYRDFRIMNSNDVAVTVSAGVSGEARDFCRSNESEVRIPANSIRSVRVWIEPPKGTPVREFKGYLDVLMVDYEGKPAITGNTSGAMTVMLGSSARLNITITGNESKSIKVENLFIRSVEHPLPMGLDYRIYNSGNVELKPMLRVVVYGISRQTSARGQAVEEYDVELGSLFPNELAIGSAEIGMGRLVPGNYSVDLWAYAEKADYSQGRAESYMKSMPLEIFSKGFRTLLGSIDGLDVDYSKSGYPIKTTMSFRNIGEIGMSARMVMEIYEKAIGNKLVHQAESNALEMGTGELRNFTLYYTPEYDGEYTVRARMVYGSSLSYEKVAVKESKWLSREVILPGENIRQREMESNLYIIGLISAAIAFIYIIWKVHNK